MGFAFHRAVRSPLCFWCTRMFTCLLAAAAGACSPDAPPSKPGQPVGWDVAARLPEAVDRDVSPDVLEVDLEARVASIQIVPGGPTPVWTYNGQLPGPLLRAPVGARVIVHFTNNLPEETTIHWHGVRLTADMDGVPAHSQPAVPPGGSFDYAFTVPDSGLYWYHPHVRSARQVGDGLYGALLVEPRPAPAVREEPDGLGDPLVLVLSDIGVNDDGTLLDREAGGDLLKLFGGEGTVVLVNGKIAPVVQARRGLRQRWRIVNAATSRYFQLAMTGHSFVRIGGDGGLLVAPEESQRLLLTPGQRADVLVTPQGEPGTRVPVRWVPYDRGFGSAEFRPEVDAFIVQIADDEPVVSGPIPNVLRQIAPLDTAGAVARAIALTQATVDDKLVLGIDGVPAWAAEPLTARVGDTEIWTVTNEMAWDHPFHLHGFFFQAVDPLTKAVPARPEWRDTLNVPRMETAAFVVRYDDRPGMWMFHCHILDHADAGMMGMVHLSR